MHSKTDEPRTAQDALTSLRSGLLNPNGLARPVLLWCLTLLLWLPGLGNLPLRDWDEGRVATVARSTMERLSFSDPNLDWLLAWKWHEAYLNKPPGLHWLIGASSRLLGEQEGAVRLLPCLIASLAIPLIFGLRRQLGGPHAERKALLAGLILMTLLPMARHGRLAMLDGSLVSSMLLLCTGWLSSRSHPWHGLLAGLGITGTLMLKPPAVLGFLLITAAISTIDRGQSRWHPSAVVWMVAGSTPGIAWHLWHLSQRGSDALLMWGGQGLSRVVEVVGDSTGAWVMPLTEVLEGGWPWLLLLPAGVIWAWRQRNNSVGRWELGLLLGSAALVLPLRTQLPWYSHLLWPSIALLCAEGLESVVSDGRPRWVGRIWSLLGALVLLGAVVVWGAGLLQLPATPLGLPTLSLFCAGSGLMVGGLQVLQPTRQQRRRGLITLLAGWGLALLALWQSPFWLWELNESWDPRPVAAAIRQLPDQAPVILKGPTRPSLGWYAGRELLPKHAQHQGEYWVVSRKPLEGCQAAFQASQTQNSQWQLWRCTTP